MIIKLPIPWNKYLNGILFRIAGSVKIVFLGCDFVTKLQTGTFGLRTDS